MAKSAKTGEIDTPANVVDASAPETAGEAKPKTRQSEQIIYVGPTFVENEQLFNYGQVFRNGLPEAWRKKADADANFRMLLVGTEKLGASLADRDRPGSPLAMAMDKIRKAQAKKGKKG